MADIAVLSPRNVPIWRKSLVPVDNNIVHPSKQTNSKIDQEQHDTKAVPQLSAAPESLETVDRASAHGLTSHPGIDLNATHLISSPYPEFANQLRLSDLETPFKLFAFALSVLRPIREDYATAPYLESFNWSEVFALLRTLCEQTGFQWKEFGFYVVIFRSQLLKDADRERLGLLDQKSHEEACQSGGLLKYWFGSTDGERRNLATCLWRDRQDASLGGSGPWHKQARASARVMYENITFHTHKLIVTDDASSWTLAEYS